MEFALDKFEGAFIDDGMLREAAQLFSSHYGVWGPLAEVKMGSFAKQGRRVRMNFERIKDQILPSSPGARNVYVRVRVDGKLVGNVFANRWVYEGRSFCWITQLCISANFRRRGLATKLLLSLREGKHDRGFGILSSHPAALLAALRAFGHESEDVDHSMAKSHASSIMQSCPVAYVRTAKLRGSVFERASEDGTVSCADTGFYVDHQEPLAAIQRVCKNRGFWPFGELPEGCEFLAIIDGQGVNH